MLALWFAVVAIAGLPVRASHLDVEIVGTYAELTWTQVLEVEGQSAGDAYVDVPKPPSSAITGVEIALGDDRVSSRAVDGNTAQERYREGLEAGRVAGISLRDEPDRLHIALDELPDEPIRVSVSWSATARRAHGGLHLDLPIISLGGDPTVSIHLIGPTAIAHVELEADLPPMRGAPGEVVIQGPVDGDRDLTLRWVSAPREPEVAAVSQGPVTLVWLQGPDSVPRRRAIPRNYVFQVDALALDRPDLVRRAFLDAIVRLDRRDTVRVAGMPDTEPLGRARPATAKVRLELKRWVRDLDRPWPGRLFAGETGVLVTGNPQPHLHHEGGVALRTVEGPELDPRGGWSVATVREGEDPRAAIRRFVNRISTPILADLTVAGIPIPDLAVDAPTALLDANFGQGRPIHVVGRSSEGAWRRTLTPRPVSGEVLRIHHALEHVDGRPALAAELGIGTPGTPLVLVRTAPDGAETWAVPVDVRLSGLARAIEDATGRRVATRDLLQRVPTGRSYQTAIGLAAGITGGRGNRSIGFGSNENTYILDGANITDPVTGTFSMNFNYDAVDQIENYLSGLMPRYQGATGGVIELRLASGTNTLEVDVGWSRTEIVPGRTAGTEVRSALSGPVVRDELWSVLGFEYLEAPVRDLRSASLSDKMTWQPTAELRFSAVGALSSAQVDAGGQVDTDALLGQLRAQWFASSDTTLEAMGTFTEASTGADTRARQQVAAELAVDSVAWGATKHDLALGADLERIGWEPGGRLAQAWPIDPPSTLEYARVSAFAQDASKLTPWLALNGGLRLDHQHARWLPAPRAYAAIRATDTTKLTGGFGRSWSPVHFADSLAVDGPASSRKDEFLARVAQELGDVALDATGTLRDFQGLLDTSFGRQDLRLVAGMFEVRKVSANRWEAAATYTRTGVLRAPERPLYGLQELGRFQDKVSVWAAYDLPTDPWTQTLGVGADLRLNPLLPAIGDPSGLQVPAPANRTLEARFRQRIDVREGNLDVDLSWRHLTILEDVEVPELLLVTDPLPDLPGYEGHRVMLGIDYGF